MVEFTGKISACLKHSSICHFDCCCQNNPSLGELPIPASSLLLAPEELDGKMRIGHILITRDNYFGGSLGFCDATKIDQSKCDSSLNYKSLDCRSYPFFPRLVNNKLVLYKDSHCPLGEVDSSELQKIYPRVFSLWMETLKNPNIRQWINQVKLPSYRLYIPQK